MGLLRRAAGAAVWGTGKLVSRHVLPDTLIPSWKTTQRISRAGSLLSRPFKRKKRKKTATTSRATSKSASYRPGPVKQKQKFDKNAWNQGRALKSDASWSLLPSSGLVSRPTSSPKQRPRWRQQLHDVRHNPQLVLQMKMDELKHDVSKLSQQVKSRVSSSLRYH